MKACMTVGVAVMLLIAVFGCYSVAQTNSGRHGAEGLDEAKAKQGAFEESTITYRNALRDWKRIFANTPAGKAPSTSDAEDLAGKLFQDPSIKFSATDTTGDVCSAGFYRIEGTAGYSLVASYDVNGRKFCNNLAVIHRAASGLSAFSTFVEEVDDVSQVVGEIQADGKRLLIFPIPFSVYEGANSCIAVWMEI